MNIPIAVDQLLRDQIVEQARIECKERWNPEVIVHTLCAFANDTVIASHNIDPVRNTADSVRDSAQLVRDTADSMRNTERQMRIAVTAARSKQRDAGLTKRDGTTKQTRYVPIAQVESLNNEDMNPEKATLEYTSGGELTERLERSATHEC